jgi:hypothetical protein
MNIGGQFNISFGKQPQLNHKDLDNRDPQDHPKPGQGPERLSGSNAKHGHQNRHRNRDSHEMREDQSIDATLRKNPQPCHKEGQAESLMDVDNPGK